MSGLIICTGGRKSFCNSCGKYPKYRQGLRFTIHSPDGDQGYPGAMDVSATYRLVDNVLSLDFEAKTTKPTVINLTNHAYWNLAGTGSGLTQEVEMPADHYLPLHGPKLPTGEIRDVTGTEFDFRKLRKVGQAYDTCFCLNGKRGQLRKGLTLRDPASGRVMEVYTTECAIQFYTADHFGPAMPGKYGHSGAAWFHCDRATELSRCAEPHEFSIIGFAPRRGLSPPHGMAVFEIIPLILMPCSKHLLQAEADRRASGRGKTWTYRKLYGSTSIPRWIEPFGFMSFSHWRRKAWIFTSRGALTRKRQR